MGGNERYGSEVLVCFLFQGPSIKGTSGRLGKYSGERHSSPLDLFIETDFDDI